MIKWNEIENELACALENLRVEMNDSIVLESGGLEEISKGGVGFTLITTEDEAFFSVSFNGDAEQVWRGSLDIASQCDTIAQLATAEARDMVEG